MLAVFFSLFMRGQQIEQAKVLWVCLAIPSTGRIGDRNDCELF